MGSDDKPKPSRARDRTQLHLRRLLAGAASGALLGCSSTTQDSSDPGYGVVDPMPPPARCEGAASMFKGTAEWKTTGNVRLLEIKLVAVRSTVTLTGEVTNTSATVMSSKTEGDTTTILIDPHAPTPSTTTVVSLTCAAGPGGIVLNVHADTEHPDSNALLVELYDQR